MSLLLPCALDWNSKYFRFCFADEFIESFLKILEIVFKAKFLKSCHYHRRLKWLNMTRDSVKMWHHSYRRHPHSTHRFSLILSLPVDSIETSEWSKRDNEKIFHKLKDATSYGHIKRDIGQNEPSGTHLVPDENRDFLFIAELFFFFFLVRHKCKQKKKK